MGCLIRLIYAEHYLYKKTVYEAEFKAAGNDVFKRTIEKHQLDFAE